MVRTMNLPPISDIQPKLREIRREFQKTHDAMRTWKLWMLMSGSNRPVQIDTLSSDDFIVREMLLRYTDMAIQESVNLSGFRWIRYLIDGKIRIIPDRPFGLVTIAALEHRQLLGKNLSETPMTIEINGCSYRLGLLDEYDVYHDSSRPRESIRLHAELRDENTTIYSDLYSVNSFFHRGVLGIHHPSGYFLEDPLQPYMDAGQPPSDAYATTDIIVQWFPVFELI